MAQGRPSGPSRAETPAAAGRAHARLLRGAFGSRAGQRGLTLVLLLALIMMGALYTLVSQLGRAAQRIDRDVVTANALAEAKQALIGYAARDTRLRPRASDRSAPPPGPPDPTTYYFSGALVSGYGAAGTDVQANDRPGTLPCPAPDESGIAVRADDCASWSAAGSGEWKNRVGWLPWRTLGIPPLRDADGNLLWYAVSDSVRNGNLNSGGTPLVLNSDSVHRAPPDPFAFRPLTVQGTAPAQNAVAVVFAPGQALPGQDRLNAKYSVRSYLEGANNYLDNDAGAVSDDVFEMQPRSAVFNDTLVSITAQELFSVVENAVALRMQRTVVPRLQQYYADWGGLPYPAAFDADKARNDFAGAVPGTLPVTSTSVIAGHLPILRADQASLLTWNTTTSPPVLRQRVSPSYSPFDPSVHVRDASMSPVDDPGPLDTVNVGSLACTQPAPEVLRCTFDTNGTTRVMLTATVDNAARGVVSMASITDSSAFPGETVAGSAQQDGSANVEYKAIMPSGANRAELTRPAVDPNLTLDAPGATTGWFVQNQWYRLVRYAVAPGAAPGRPTAGPGAVAECTAGTTATCLDARHANGTVEFSRAVLVLAGSKAFKAGPTAQLRQDEAGAATTDLANYFESGNLSAGLQYEEKRRATQPAAAFNDRLAGYKAP